MTKDDLFEDIRALLKQPQAFIIDEPWDYGDEDLIIHVRSALRHLRSRGVTLEVDFSIDGELTGDLTESTGVLVSLYVAAYLLRGDLNNKVLNGSVGVVWRAGMDMLDTKTAAISLVQAAKDYERQYKELLMIVLSDAGTIEVFGEPGTNLP